MSNHRPPAFQLYVRDFLTDPKVMLMTLEQRGAYIFLLCHAWLSDEPGYLPLDDRLLSKLSGARGRWPKIREQVLAAFDLEVRPGWAVQKRMVSEREQQESRYLKAVDGGRKSWQGAALEKRIKRAVEADAQTGRPVNNSEDATR